MRLRNEILGTGHWRRTPGLWPLLFCAVQSCRASLLSSSSSPASSLSIIFNNGNDFFEAGMGRKKENAGEKGGEEEEEEDEDGVTTSTASAFGLHHFRLLRAGGPVPPQTCLLRNCNKLGDGNGVIGAATAGKAVPTASGAVRAAGKEFSNEGSIVSERGM